MWERIISLEISNVTLVDKTGKDFNNLPENYPDNLLKSSLNLQYGFYPNTRTSANASIGYVGEEEPTYGNTDVQSKFWKNEISFGFNCGYYISPQIQIHGNLNMNYGFEEYGNGEHKRIHYNLGLRYAIF
jgi:hypothetical protein